MERLEDSADGGKKIFRDSTLNNLKDVVKVAESLNFKGDKKLSRVVEKLKEESEGLTAENLRNDPELRSQTREKLKSTVSEIMNMEVI